MSNAERPLFGQLGGAAEILAAAKEKVPGQTMSKEQLEKAAQRRAEQAAATDIPAAAGFTEEIVAWLNQAWNDRDFTPEQRIFSLALATINFRETVPDKFPDETPGGKAMFDRVCGAARTYYDQHKDD